MGARWDQGKVDEGLGKVLILFLWLRNKPKSIHCMFIQQIKKQGICQYSRWAISLICCIFILLKCAIHCIFILLKFELQINSLYVHTIKMCYLMYILTVKKYIFNCYSGIYIQLLPTFSGFSFRRVSEYKTVDQH